MALDSGPLGQARAAEARANAAEQDAEVARAGSDEFLTCSFCGQHQKQVQCLIAGSGARICDRCTDRVDAVLAGPDTAASTPVAVIRQVSNADRNGWCSFCGKGRHHVEAMAAAGDARICSECLSLCDEIVSDRT